MILNALNRFTVKMRLLVLVSISLLALSAVGYGGWISNHRVSASLKEMQETRLPAAILISDIRTSTNLLLHLSFEVLTREKQSNAQSQFEQTASRKRAVTELLENAIKSYDGIEKSEEALSAWNDFKTKTKPCLEINEQLTVMISEMARNDDLEVQAKLFSSYKLPLANWSAIQKKVDLSLSKVHTINQKAIDDAQINDGTTIKFARAFIVGSYCLSALVLLALAVVFVKSVTTPVDSLRITISDIATSQDLTIRPKSYGTDEISETCKSFNILIGKLQGFLLNVLRQADQIAEASTDASTASSHTTSSSSAQSEAASSIAAAVEQLTVSIAQISDNANETLGVAKEVARNAGDGLFSMSSTDHEIDGIEESVVVAGDAISRLSLESARVAEILNVIKDVADQTNLLALNAAIEAARAGEQGRGFAVVADEVRTLAERTTSSARTIEDLVQRIQGLSTEVVDRMQLVKKRVTTGRAASNASVLSIKTIGSSADKAIMSISSISDAINEQTSAARSIAQQVDMVARLAEENNATAIRTEGLSNALDALARRLRIEVSAFKF